MCMPLSAGISSDTYDTVMPVIIYVANDDDA